MILAFIIITVAIMFGLPFLVNRNPKTNSVPVFQLILGVLLLISFFLPWINADALFVDFSVRGYEVPSKFKTLYNLQDESTETNSENIFIFLLYLLYLIPISSLAVIILGFYRRNKEIVYATSLIGTITMLLIICTIVIKKNDGDEFISHLDIGFYLTVITGFCLWVSSLMTSNSGSIAAENENSELLTGKQDSTSKGDDIFSQLLKLQTLKEKNVINEEVYERERKKLLGQLDKS